MLAELLRVIPTHMNHRMIIMDAIVGEVRKRISPRRIRIPRAITARRRGERSFPLLTDAALRIRLISRRLYEPAKLANSHFRFSQIKCLADDALVPPVPDA